MINSMMEYGSKIAFMPANEFNEITIIHDRQNFDEPRSTLCGADEWATSYPSLVTCPDCLASASTP
jgi:hypothetical protein